MVNVDSNGVLGICFVMAQKMKNMKTKNEKNKTKWWEAPDGDEWYTPRVWEAIANAAEAAGDKARARVAREAAERLTNTWGV